MGNDLRVVAMQECMDTTGASKVVAHFYGGNDEGFVEEPEFFIGEMIFTPAGDEKTQQAVAEIGELLELEVWDRVGGYDGEPAVEGDIEFISGQPRIDVTGSQQEWVDTIW